MHHIRERPDGSGDGRQLPLVLVVVLQHLALHRRHLVLDFGLQRPADGRHGFGVSRRCSDAVVHRRSGAVLLLLHRGKALAQRVLVSGQLPVHSRQFLQPTPQPVKR